MKHWIACHHATGALAALVLFLAVGAAAQTTNTLSEAEIQGRKLAQQLLEQTPTTNSTQTGILNIRDANNNRTNIPVQFKVIVYPHHWTSDYLTYPNFWKKHDEHDPLVRSEVLDINHVANLPNDYSFMDSFFGEQGRVLPTRENMPFAGSDFWLCDLGLEFFHWPAQKILPKTTNLMRGRDYTLLESTNPNPTTNGYSRVVSWIDKETGGILEAEAYDAGGKLLKEFAPKSFKKVNGQWELQEMEIRNVQTGSRTRLEFDLKK
jgi:hypothetical protein